MIKRGGAISAVGGAIDSLLKSSEIDAAIRPHRAVVLWPEVVGEHLAAVSEAEVVRSGVLFVRARSTTWANELTFYKSDLVQKLNQRLGARAIEDIHFKAGGRRLAGVERQAMQPAGRKGPSEADLASVSLRNDPLACLAEDADERIRRVVERAARTQAWKREQGWRACQRCGTLFAPDHAGALCGLCALRRNGLKA